MNLLNASTVSDLRSIPKQGLPRSREMPRKRAGFRKVRL
jgi:hypothetical protein